LDQNLRSDPPREIDALLCCTHIAPYERRAHNMIPAVQHYSAMHLTGESDTGDLIAG
jgi:hypothetical protein